MARIVVSQVPLPALLIDEACSVVAINEAACGLLGADPAPGELKLELPPAPVSRITFTNPRGEAVSAVLSSRPVRGGGSLLVLADISPERRANSELAERGRMMASMLDDFPGMAYRCRLDPDWTMEFVTRGCVELTGYAPEELVHNKVVAYGDLIVLEERDRVAQAVKSSIVWTKEYTIIYHLATRSGKTKLVWERGRPVVGPDGAATAVDGYVSDIT